MQTSPEVDVMVEAFKLAGIQITKHREAFNTLMGFQMGTIPADKCVQELKRILNAQMLTKLDKPAATPAIPTKMHKRGLLYMYGVSLWQIGALDDPPASRASVWGSVRRFRDLMHVDPTKYFRRAAQISNTEAAIVSRVYDANVVQMLYGDMAITEQVNFLHAKVQEFIANNPD